MLFTKKFKIIEIQKNGLIVTTYLKGFKKDVNKDIDEYKKLSYRYEMIGKEGMVIWV